MEKIRYISDAKLDDVDKYGKYAKEKIQITYDTSNGYMTRNFYLDNPLLDKELTKYSDSLRQEKKKINGKYLGKRIKYNAIMAGLSLAVFFTGLGVGNILMSLGLNEILVYNLILFSTALIDAYGFIHVNQEKYYYKKSEIENLKKINNELSKCDTIEQKINSLDKNELVDINFKREQIDNFDLRVRNYRRNTFLREESRHNLMEAEERIRMGVQQRLDLNQKRAYNEETLKKKLLLSDNIYKYRNKFKLTTKRLGKNVGKWFADAFQDEVPQRVREENYVMRGEKRR